MSLLDRVTQHLEGADVRYALIGAAAMAYHGVARSTFDVDLLTVDRRVLHAGFWDSLRGRADIDTRQGSVDDPLAGVVRIRQPDERPVDLVVGRSAWQAEAIRRAEIGSIGDTRLPVAGAAELVLLKLYAGGPQDAWDVQQLLALEHQAHLVERVETLLEALDPEARELWSRILAGR
jgi:hypothetical protein